MSRAAPAGPQIIAEGRGIGASHFELVADRKTGLLPGDTIRLGRNRFTVVGLVEGGDELGRRSGGLHDAGRRDGAADRTRPGSPAGAGGARGGVSVKSASVAAVIARMAPGADVDLLTATVRQWKHLAAMTQAEQEEHAARLGGGQGAPPDRAVPRHPAGGQRRGDRADHLHDDHGEAEADRHAEADRRPDRTIIGLIVQQALILGASGWGIGLVLILTVKDYFPRRVVLEPFNVMVLAGIIAAVCLLSSAARRARGDEGRPGHRARELTWRSATP
jgi:putative ABC transport system permease protein